MLARRHGMFRPHHEIEQVDGETTRGRSEEEAWIAQRMPSVWLLRCRIGRRARRIVEPPLQLCARSAPLEGGKVSRSPCQECGAEDNLAGEGFVVHAWDERGRPKAMRRCDCYPERIERRRLSRVRRQIPAKFQNLSLDRNPLAGLPPKPLKVLERYLRDIPARVDAGQGLWFSGNAGRGKSAAACLIVEEAQRQGVPAEFWPIPELMMRLQRIRHDDDFRLVDHEEAFHELLADVPLLVLDDVSAMKPTGYAVEQLYVIANRRYNIGRGRATIVTCDIDTRLLSRRLGWRMVRRLQEGATIVNFNAPAEQAPQDGHDGYEMRDVG
jgi:DNA replication protein DnaC